MPLRAAGTGLQPLLGRRAASDEVQKLVGIILPVLSCALLLLLLLGGLLGGLGPRLEALFGQRLRGGGGSSETTCGRRS